jgi:hypothetical protein
MYRLKKWEQVGIVEVDSGRVVIAEPFVDPDEVRAIKLERAEKADPATATTLREVRSLREVYTLAVNSMRQEILTEADVAVPVTAGR